MIPISCLTEFPNVVQMAKVRAWFSVVLFCHCNLSDSTSGLIDHLISPVLTKAMDWFLQQTKNKKEKNLIHLLSLFSYSQLVCEEVNVDRFFPVLYPKVCRSPPFHTFKMQLNVYFIAKRMSAPDHPICRSPPVVCIQNIMSSSVWCIITISFHWN